MDGLECSEILLSHAKREESRFDSEYYSKENLLLQTIIDTAGNKTINEYGGVLDCSAFYPSITGYYSNDRSLIPFIRVNEIANGLILITDNTVFLPANIIEDNNKTIAVAYPGDIIIAKGGNTLAKVGLATDEFPMYATCRDVIILRTTSLQGLNRHYLWSFLHSSFGQRMLWRSASQTGQPHLTLPAITKIKVPEYKKLQDKIEKLYTLSVCKKQESNSGYRDAETILLTFLCISEKAYKSTGIAVKSISESFRVTGRLDAEYYQPKYDEYASIIGHFNGGSSLIRTEFSQVKKICDRKLSSYKYIEIGDVNVSSGFATANEVVTPYLPDNAKIMTEKDDIIISTVRPNRGAVAVLEDDNLLVSGAFTVLREKGTYKKEVLQVLLRLPFYRDWLLRYNVGTSYPVIKDNDVLNMPIPLFDKETQNDIAQKVKESTDMRNQSKQLLEYAKQAVEMAIEQGEDVALKWLKDKVNLSV